jgi:hypothetical protein
MRVLSYLLSLTCIASPLLLYSNGWSPNPAVRIPGSDTSSTIVIPSYNSLSSQFLVTWTDLATSAPFYAVFDGTNWSTPAPISVASATEYPVFPSFGSTPNEFLATWSDRNSQSAIFATFDGTTWTSPAPIPNTLPVIGAVTSSFNSVDGEFLVTWIDLDTQSPFFLTFDGTAWSSPAMIPGSLPVAQSAAVLPVYDPLSDTFLAVWADGASNNPFYALFDGTNWTSPAPIPGSTATSTGFVFPAYAACNASSGLFLVAWYNPDVLQPYFATYDGTTWSVPASISTSSHTFPVVTVSCDSTTGTFFAGWRDSRASDATYATYDGLAWSSDAVIPASLTAIAPPSPLVLQVNFSLHGKRGPLPLSPLTQA